VNVNENTKHFALSHYVNFFYLVYTAHWSFLDDALYKFTYLLTYLLSLPLFVRFG